MSYIKALFGRDFVEGTKKEQMVKEIYENELGINLQKTELKDDLFNHKDYVYGENGCFSLDVKGMSEYHDQKNPTTFTAELINESVSDGNVYPSWFFSNVMDIAYVNKDKICVLGLEKLRNSVINELYNKTFIKSKEMPINDESFTIPVQKGNLGIPFLPYHPKKADYGYYEHRTCVEIPVSFVEQLSKHVFDYSIEDDKYKIIKHINNEK